MGRAVIRILLAVALVLLCSVGAAVLLSGWRPRRQRRIQEEHEAEAVRTLEDVARRWGM